jgi:hypothetical protein
VAESFEERYPNIASWISAHESQIEIGASEYSRSMVRVLDLGGLVWGSEKRYASIEEALADADRAIAVVWGSG